MCARTVWMLKVKREVDLRGIYIKEEAKSGKTPARDPIRTSAVKSTSHHRTWGTWSRKNLLKVHLECQNVRSMSWVVKKASSRAEVECREYRVITVMSKYSFLPEEPERRISRGYCRGIGPRSPLFIWVLGLRPKPRTRDLSRRVKHYQGNPY